MQVVELKTRKTEEKINDIDFIFVQKENWNIRLNDEILKGKFEKSDLRLFIECLDVNHIYTPDLLLNGTRVGYIENRDVKQLIHKLDNLIHH